MIMARRWHNYGKPRYYSSKGKGKEHRGDRKKKIEWKRGRGRNKKISPVLGPALIQSALIQPALIQFRSWGAPPDQVGGPSFKPPFSCP